jgi:hypothetical protein
VSIRKVTLVVSIINLTTSEARFAIAATVFYYRIATIYTLTLSAAAIAANEQIAPTALFALLTPFAAFTINIVTSFAG